MTDRRKTEAAEGRDRLGDLHVIKDVLVIVSAGGMILFVAGLLLRPWIQSWIEKVAARRKE